MALTPGTRLGPYEVLALIGVGGMGEVYKATDTNLKRAVAIKVLPAAVAADAERLARFQREAEVLASLNHPNIAQIHGLEKSDGMTALVMELVEGPTLAEQIAGRAGPSGPAGLPLDEALPIARQIADALEAAHERGIIHRDLKPANIKVTPNGVVKVLDFGLAKAMEPAGAMAANASMSPTLSLHATMAGVILGTAAYMSPEQARGRAVDKRTDLWAFGCVLYEILTGRRPFDGDDVAVTLGAVIHKEPDWRALPADTPASIRRLLLRCLTKDPKGRIADASTARLEIVDAVAAAGSEAPAVESRAPQPMWRRLAIPAATLLIGATAAAATVVVLLRPAPQPVSRLTMAAPANAPAAVDDQDRSFAMAPDGLTVAYTSAASPMYSAAINSANVRLFVRQLDQLEPTQVAGPGSIREPVFSPDGAWVGFFGPASTTQLQKVSAAGGPAIAIATVDGASRGAAWGLDDTIIYATNNAATGLQRISANGGGSTVLTRPNADKGERDHVWPHLLPGGRAVLFTILTTGPIENAQIAVLDLRDGSRKVIVNGGSDARYVDGGYIVYGNAGTLRAVAFDEERLEVRGTPVPVLQQLLTTRTYGAANFAVAGSGTLAYVSGNVVGASGSTIVWVDRTGREEPLKLPSRPYSTVQLSPDAGRLALNVLDQPQGDVWIWDLMRETLQRLTFDPVGNLAAVWTPDGKRVAFSSGVDGGFGISWQAADGSGLVEPMTTKLPRSMRPSDVLSDASALIYEPNGDPRDIGLVRIGGAKPAAGMPLLAGPANEMGGTVSPDGRWLAYQSDESGRYEVYVRPFPAVNSGRWQISTGGGTRPRWARSGRELFYVTEGVPVGMMAVSVTAGLSFAAGSPVKLFEGKYSLPTSGRTVYDVSSDGKRFLMIKESEFEATPLQIIVVQHWADELRRLVPTK